MSSVDDRIVKMGFESGSFTKGIHEAMKNLTNLDQTLAGLGKTTHLNSLSKALGNVDTKPLEHGIHEITNRLSTMDIIGTTALVNIANQAVDTGKRMISAITIDPITSGFDEYELKMRSIQTIMSGTGESLEKVNEMLNELNAYSDRTIYSFSDMTSSIGKFTNAGVKLEDAVMAIKGVSNAAALAGVGTQQASAAMYNFSQALSSGYMNLVDWRSIEQTAQMGTIQFKQELLNTAVALGTVVKQGNKYITTTTNLKGKTSDLFGITDNFTGSLQHQWMTTEVLTETLKKYADETTELGKRSYAAAQDVRTFTDLIGTVQESAQSGWATTWEIIIGDLNEAKNLWTMINGMIGPVVQKMSDYRNTNLMIWKESGGREDLIKGISNLAEALSRVVSPIAKAFTKILNPLNSSNLLSLTKGFEYLTDKLILSERASAGLEIMFSKLFQIIKMILAPLKPLSNILAGLFVLLTNIIDAILMSVGAVMTWVDNIITATGVSEKLASAFEWVNRMSYKFADAMTYLGNISLPAISYALDVTGKAIDKYVVNFKTFAMQVLNKIQEIKSFAEAWWQVHEPVEKVKNAFIQLGEAISNTMTAIKNDVMSTIDKLHKGLESIFKGIQDTGVEGIDFINAGLFVAVFAVVKKLIAAFKALKADIKPIQQGLSEALEGLKETLEMYQKDIKADRIKKIAVSIALLASAIYILSKVEPERLIPATSAVGALAAGLMVSLKIFSKIDLGELKNALTKSAVIISLTISLNLIASVVKKLGSMDTMNMVQGLAGLAGVLVGLRVVIHAMNKMPIMIKGTANIATLLAVTSIIGSLARAVKMLGGLSWSAIAKGLTATASLLAAFAIFIKLTANTLDPSAAIKITTGLLPLAVSLNILAGALYLYGSMNIEKLKQGILTIGILFPLLAMLGHGFKGVDRSMIDLGLGLTGLAMGMNILAAAIFLYGNMKPATIAQGILSLASALVVIAATTSAMPVGNMVGIGAGFALLSAGMISLALAMKLFENISFEAIGKGLLTIVVTLTTMGIASAALSGSIVVLLGIGASISLIAAGLAGFGAALTILSGGLMTLSATIAATGLSITGALLALIAVLPVFAASLALSIVSFITILGYNAEPLGRAFGSLLNVMLGIITAYTPKLAEALTIFATNIIKGLITIIPTLVDGIGALIKGIADMLIENTPIIIDLVLELIVGVLTALTENLPQIAYQTILFLTGLIGAVLTGLAESIPVIAQGIVDIVVAMIDALAMMTVEIIDAVWKFIIKVVDGFTDSIEENTPVLSDAFYRLITTCIKVFADSMGGWLSKGKEIMVNLFDGIAAKAGSVWEKVKEIGSGCLQKIKDTIGNWWQVGADAVQGLINGIGSKVQAVWDKVTGIGKGMLKSLKGSLDEHSPSKEMKKIGVFAIKGLEVGLDNETPTLMKGVTKVGNRTLDAMNKVLSAMSMDWSSIISDDHSPVITPIVDLSNIENAKDIIDSSFNNTILGTKRFVNITGNTSNDDKDTEVGRKIDRLINLIKDLSDDDDKPKPPVIVQSILDGRIIAESTAPYSDNIAGKRQRLHDRGVNI